MERRTWRSLDIQHSVTAAILAVLFALAAPWGADAQTNCTFQTGLCPDQLIVPASASTGATIVVTAIIINHGTAASEPSTYTVELGSGTLAGTPIPALASFNSPGDRVRSTTTFVVPGGLAPCNCSLTVRLLNGTFNIATLPVTEPAPSPDLKAVGLDFPASGPAGKTVALTASVTNIGTATSTQTQITFFLKQSASVVTSMGGAAVGAITPGASLAVAGNGTIPSSVPLGDYVLGFRVNGVAAGQIPATTADNTFETTSTFNVTPGADLIGESVVFSPTTTVPGGTLHVGGRVRNSGTGDGVASVCQFFLSTGASLTGPAPVLRVGPYVTVGALAAGASGQVNTDLTLPNPMASGDYFVLMQVNANGAAAESNAANDVAVSPNKVQVHAPPPPAPPDLQMVSVGFSSPTTALSNGASARVTAVIANAGGRASNSTQVGYFLLALTQGNPRFPLGFVGISGISPAAKTGASATFVVSGTVPAGDYELGARVDSEAAGESSTTAADNELINANNILHVSPSSPPVADAGPSRAVGVGRVVILDGSGSSDPSRRILSYAWSQVSGTTVSLHDPILHGPTVSFTPPIGDVYVFRLDVVTPGQSTATATVEIDAVSGSATLATIGLHQGLNLVSMHLSPATTGGSFDAGDLAHLTGARFVVRAQELCSGGRLEAFIPGIPTQRFPILRDRGYVLSVPVCRSVTYSGYPWPER
ncbi:MAG: hypothetical protein HY303_13665 [Candidatus Wallbacteria bacterium]|nr:hypothetical protein [Candidatus Wallbacteria bacterium]